MLAFHDDPQLKTFVLDQLSQHRTADQIVQGYGYWKDGKGCAVGCTLEAVRRHRGSTTIDHDHHKLYETELGVPQALARLEDRIFEGLPKEVAQRWPERFIAAIAPGADLAMVVPRFLLWLLSDELPPHVKQDKYPKTSAALNDVAALYREWVETGTKPTRERWVTARDAAAAAGYADAAYGADAADAAYAYAAYAAAAYAADAADAAAYDAAAAAAYAADAADAADAYAADAADAAAAYAAAAYAARRKPREAAYERHADKLIKLLSGAPIRQQAA